MTEKLNIKVFLGDNPTPEDFSFSQLSTKTGSILPTTSNDLFFSSDKVIPFQTFETEEERIRVLTNSSVFSSNIKNSIKVPKQEEIRTFNNNIITVLFFLFPTFYNSTPNIHNSFDDKVPHNGVAKIDAPVLKKNKKMANLTDGIVYYKENTVVQLTWKNDVFNVPEFQQLFSAIYGFYVWSKTEGTQKINADLQKIVENLVDPRNGIAQALERENTAILDDKSNPFSSSSSRYETKSNIPVGEIERVKEAFTKLKTNYDTLKGQYDTRKKELATESKEKNPVEKTKESKQKYDIVLKTTVQTITEQIAILKYFDETYSQSQTTPAVSIVKRTIERFSNLITNRTLNDALDKNDYIFEPDNGQTSLPKNQQVVYANLAKYTEYKKMAEAVANFRSFVFKTSNPDLDILCNDFFNNSNRNLLYFIMHIQKNFLYSTRGKPVLETSFENIAEEIAEQGRNSFNLYYVGGITQRSDKKKILIYVGIDAIKGKVTTINQDKLQKCLFGNERLGNLFTELTETTNRAIVKNYFYDVLQDGSFSISETEPVQPQQVQQGGRKTRKHFKRQKRRRPQKHAIIRTKKRPVRGSVR